MGIGVLVAVGVEIDSCLRSVDEVRDPVVTGATPHLKKPTSLFPWKSFVALDVTSGYSKRVFQNANTYNPLGSRNTLAFSCGLFQPGFTVESVNIQLRALTVKNAFKETHGFRSVGKGLAMSFGKLFKC